MVTERGKKILNHVGLFGVLILMSVLIAQSVGLGRTGFDSTEVLTQFFFYAGPGAVFLIAILVFFFTDLFTDAGDVTYGNSVAFASPEEPPALIGKWFSNPAKIAILGGANSFL